MRETNTHVGVPVRESNSLITLTLNIANMSQKTYFTQSNEL